MTPAKTPNRGYIGRYIRKIYTNIRSKNQMLYISGDFLINLCPRIKRDQSRNVIQALGFILPKFQPERSHGDPFYIDFYGLCVFLVQVGDHLLGA